MRRGSATTLEKIGYASGNLGKNVVFASLDYFLLFFLTEVWGLAPAQAGMIILLALVWDGVADPVMGSIVDHAVTPFGRYRPYLLVGAPLCAAAFVFVFMDPGVEGGALIAWTLMSTLLFRTAYTVCDVPHNALLARIAPEPKAAAFVSGARFIFSSIGGLLIGVAATQILATPDVVIQAERFSGFSVFAAAIFAVTMWIAWLSTRGVDREPDVIPESTPLLVALTQIFRNPALLWLLAAAFVQAVTIPSFAKCLAYFGSLSLNDPAWSGIAIVVLTLAQTISVPFWVALAQRVAHANLLISSLVVAATGATMFFVFHGQEAGRFVALIVFGVAIGGLNVVIWALLPAVIAWGETTHGRRAEGLPAGLFLLSLKAGSGIGAAMLGILFQLYGIGERQSEPASNFAIVGIMSALPILGGIVCAFIAFVLGRSLMSR